MGQIEDDASFILRAPHRVKVMRRLMKGTAMPTQIRDDTKLEYSRITESVNSLKEQDLVELIVNEDTKRGRLYTVTDRGEEVWEWMIENNMIDDDRS